MRPVEALPGCAGGEDPGRPPEAFNCAPACMLIDEDYQRQLSKRSWRQIEQMAVNWDWAAYKAISLAEADQDGWYEVIDGQHTAIAAATNGHIPLLPCLLMPTKTLADRARSFLTINTMRINLTRPQIFNAQVAAQEEAAVTVECAMRAAGVTMLQHPPNNGKTWRVGETMAVGALLKIATARDQAYLERVLRIAVAAQAAPISAGLLRGIHVAFIRAPRITDDAVVRYLKAQGCGRLEIIARAETGSGMRAFETIGEKIAQACRA